MDVVETAGRKALFGTKDVVELLEKNVEANRTLERRLDQMKATIDTMKAENKRIHDDNFKVLDLWCKLTRRNSHLLPYSASRSRSRNRRAVARAREFDIARPAIALPRPVEATVLETTLVQE